MCQGSLGAANSAHCPAQRGPCCQHFALGRVQRRGAGTTRHHQKACLRLSAGPHHAGRDWLQATEQAGAAPGRPLARGCGIARHCPAACCCSNTHPKHLGIGKCSPCTHLPTPHSPMVMPWCRCQPRLGREPAGPDAHTGQHSPAPGQPGMRRAPGMVRHIPRPPTGTVPRGVPLPAPGPCPKFLDASP